MFLLSVAAIPNGVAQQTAFAAKSTVKVGVYITRIGEFDLSKNSFTVTFWGWFLHPDRSYLPLETAEIINAKSFDSKFTMSKPKENVQWENEIKTLWLTEAKYSATIFQNWDIKNFPFDRQILEIIFEDGLNDNSYIAYVADTENSGIDSAVIIPGWVIEGFKVFSKDVDYNTNFGDPKIVGGTHYSQIRAQIAIKREGFRLLFNLFIGFFVAFTLASLTYFMDVESLAASRVSVCAGAIFAATGNKYIVGNYLPHPAHFTLADSIEISTFLAIIISIITVIVLLPIHIKHPRMSRWINGSAAAVSIFGYLIWNGWLIEQALMS